MRKWNGKKAQVFTGLNTQACMHTRKNHCHTKLHLHILILAETWLDWLIICPVGTQVCQFKVPASICKWLSYLTLVRLCSMDQVSVHRGSFMADQAYWLLQEEIACLPAVSQPDLNMRFKSKALLEISKSFGSKLMIALIYGWHICRVGLPGSLLSSWAQDEAPEK